MGRRAANRDDRVTTLQVFSWPQVRETSVLLLSVVWLPDVTSRCTRERRRRTVVTVIPRQGPEESMIEINGMAHVILTVSEWDRCKEFYEALLPFLGLKLAFNGQDFLYYVGGRTAVGVARCDAQYSHMRFMQTGVGLHHVCFRARSREDIDKLYAFLKDRQATIVHPPEEGSWAPGYYSVLFEDPAGVRLEANYVPGKGIFAEGAGFKPGEDYH